jgi:hypothetical protein
MTQSKFTIDDYGSKQWRNDKGQFHREDGPAIEYKDGSKAWWINGYLHREDGPAYEGSDGYKEWCINGKSHRLDGPAVRRSDGRKAWWINGEQCSEQNFPIALIQFLLNCNEKTAQLILELFNDTI